MCVLHVSPPAVSPGNKLVTFYDLFSHLLPIISSLSSFPDSSWKCFLLSVSVPWPSWEVQHEGSFWGLHCGVVCTSGRSINPDQCWLSNEYSAQWNSLAGSDIPHRWRVNQGFPLDILLGSWSYLHTTRSDRFADCFNWNSCPFKTILGTSHTAPP